MNKLIIMAALCCLIGCSRYELAISKKDICGYWVRKDYVNSIEKYKSPKHSYHYLLPITSVMLSCDNNYIELLSLFQAFSYDYYKLSKYSISIRNKYEHNKILKIRLIDSNTIKLNNYKFIKWNQKDNFPMSLINRTLFGKSYHIEGKSDSIVIFYEDGKITGLHDYNKYVVNYAFLNSSNCNDILILNMNNEIKKYLNMINKNDTLILKEIDNEDNCNSIKQVMKLIPN
jgi:hypothetical protein